MSSSRIVDLTNLLKLRITVAALGESWGCDWWPTSFLDPVSSRAFLTPVFARTANLAAYRGALEAACRVHDQHLSVGSYHLFRFREELEQDLHVLMGGEQGAIAAEALKSKGDAMAALKSLVGTASVKPAAGPVLLEGADPRSRKFVDTVSALYHAAFAEQKRCFPYFAGVG